MESSQWNAPVQGHPQRVYGRCFSGSFSGQDTVVTVEGEVRRSLATTSGGSMTSASNGIGQLAQCGQESTDIKTHLVNAYITHPDEKGGGLCCVSGGQAEGWPRA